MPPNFFAISPPAWNSSVYRCFCNQPSCAANGYMCKSEGLGCYSELSDELDNFRGNHGCIDQLPRFKEESCQNVPGSVQGVRGSLLLCCHQDMCNHIDSPETRTKYNETLLAVRSQLRVGEEGERLEYSEQDAVWFKAATVAVPICGALILLILIVLALKILRTDPQPALQPKLRVNPSRGGMMGGTNNPHMENKTKKLALLYEHNDCGGKSLEEKNETNAKLNSGSETLDLEKCSQRAGCNLYQPLISSTIPPINQNIYNKAFLIDWGESIVNS